MTLTANAGVILSVAGKEILIDALHDEKAAIFSATPPDVLNWIRTRYQTRSPDAVLATHDHPDHASPRLWDEARRLWPDSFFISPGMPLEGSLVLEYPRQQIKFGDITIRAKRLPHDGVGFKDVANYGYLLDVKGFSILIPGDCATTARDELTELIAGRFVDLALINFPWVTLSRPRAFIQDVVSPVSLVVFHLPFARDDGEGYGDATRDAVKKMTAKRIAVLSEPLQQVIIS